MFGKKNVAWEKVVVEITLPEIEPLPEEPADDQYVRDLYAWKVTAEWTWEAVLALAVRDGAETVHLHPWRLNYALSYQVGGSHYTLIPPRADTVSALLREIRHALLPNPLRRSLAWWVRGRVCGRVRLWAAGAATEWFGICWRGAGFIGAEFFRLDYAPSGSPSESQTRRCTGPL